MQRVDGDTNVTIIAIVAITTIATIVALAGLAMLSMSARAAADTPPTVELTYPTQGAVLGLELQVRGVAHDAEGFNMSSLVQLRWDEWAWFNISSTPGDDGNSLSFGEIISLVDFQPGPHVLHAQAYDGLLLSADVNVTVTVRDLADLTVSPADVSLSPRGVEGGEEAHIVVVVHNEGGEDATDVVISASRSGSEIGRVLISRVTGHANVTARIPWRADAGEVRIAVHVGTNSTERSTVNNDATAVFEVPEGSLFTAGPWFYLAVGSLAGAAILAGAYARSRRD